ncbi:hypothetical protein J2Z76_000012 [Sedimentibacter acidaminivorans]|uniref:Uncharacterized protein n=1 Tax=Sedimentibacter acidaminivorans TaxID=913099 RepID=A0ABS4G913_9FIRM|nr:hypothetical protein [Sedimentibacter acidaminivorans]
MKATKEYKNNCYNNFGTGKPFLFYEIIYCYKFFFYLLNIIGNIGILENIIYGGNYFDRNFKSGITRYCPRYY